MAFADFPEQKPVAELLQRSLERGRLAHAYLFTGPQIEPLEAVARTLAKTLNCQSPQRRGPGALAIDSCDHCLPCRKTGEDLHPDVRWVRPESKTRIITVEQIRSLLQAVYLKPTEAEFKVAIITGADRMNPAAANAFLKTLEEPPPKSILMLLSTEPQRLLETILSRCLRLTFPGAAAAADPAVVAWLTDFAQAAALGQKTLLGRYRLLGALLSQLSQAKEQIEKTLTERSPINQYPDAEAQLVDRWEKELSASIEAEYRHQRLRWVSALQWWMRDIWLHTIEAGSELLTYPQLAAQTQIIAQRVSAADSLDNLQILERTQRLLYTNVQEALILEVGLLKLKL